ncbi:glycosyl transferase family 2 [Candidatus Microgenomates bacterium]|nr:MAG: glycosyl transferase family 2 [Candidatus Microgenomates bacterium]
MYRIVDVIIPAYNSAQFIKRAVKSALTQGEIVNSIVVVNDGSTDNTLKVLERISRNEDKVKIVEKVNGGLSAARNTGILNASSKYLAFLDADDRWLPGKLAKQLAILEKDANIGVVYSDYQLVDPIGNLIVDKHRLDPRIKGRIYPQILEGNKIMGSGSSVVVRSEVFAKIGKFDEILPTCEDWDMWIRIAKKYHYDYVNEKLVEIMNIPNSLSKNSDKMTLGMCMLYDKHKKMLSSRPAMKYLYSILIPTLITSNNKLLLYKRIGKKISPKTHRIIFSFNISLLTSLMSNILHLVVTRIKGVAYDN